jgi:hypothetical protein
VPSARRHDPCELEFPERPEDATLIRYKDGSVVPFFSCGEDKLDDLAATLGVESRYGHENSFTYRQRLFTESRAKAAAKIAPARTVPPAPVDTRKQPNWNAYYGVPASACALLGTDKENPR